jgi:hypothetical protein
MLRKRILAGAVVATLIGPAAAQDEKPGVPLNYKPPPTAEEIQRQKDRDRNYDAALKKIPDKKTSSDPWAVIRPNAAQTSKNKQQ